ncbi:MAG: NAD(P)H-dependent oxidoreductase [Candidatus Omnitrophica bacterium]|nr:NAD(P)H-dependent oxidoreductase [Candidatus Omnitrophota bacterium]
MKTAIIFHSVCGNDYLLARTFFEAFIKRGQKDTELYRVSDDDWKDQLDLPEATRKHLSDMFSLPVATPEVLLDKDLILMGAPTYFGNVSAEMKAFMDATSCHWFEGKLAGKKLVAFTSYGNSESGGSLCLQSIHTYGQHMGMISVSIPTTTVPGKISSPYGVLYNSQGKYGELLDKDTIKLIEKFSDYLLKIPASR